MVDKLFHNDGSHELPKRESVKESLLILRLDNSCFSRLARMGYFLGERNMENTGTGNGYGERGQTAAVTIEGRSPSHKY